MKNVLKWEKLSIVRLLPFSLWHDSICCWVQCLKEKETFKVSAEVADWVFLNAIYVCIHSSQQRARMGTARLWCAKPRAWLTVTTARGGLRYKIPFAGLNSRLSTICCVPLWWQGHLLSTKLSCRQMWTFPEATCGCSECFRGKAMKQPKLRLLLKVQLW